MYVNWQNTGPLAPFGWLIDLGLIGVTWWCAHRLTWDCTLIDDTVDASGAGLLQVAGLEQASGTSQAAPVDKSAEKEPGLIGWWERYCHYRSEKRRQPHAPGVWVVYFSLAALPIFGLGQSRIPPDDVARRQYVFWLMIVYVGSGLGLLLTTCFLGLRRYLRQRRLQMPVAMTGAWLMVGGFLVAAFLVAGALLPRPNAEYRFIDEWLGLEPHKQQASRHAQVGDDPGKDQGRAGGARSRDREDEKGKDGEARGRKSEKDGPARAKDGKPRDRAEKDATTRDPGGKRDQAERGQRDRDRAGRKTDQAGRRERREDEKERNRGAGDRREDQEDEEKQGSSSNPSTPEFTRQVSNILKWVVGILAAVVILFLLLRSGLQFLANFTYWARRLLAAFQAFWQALLNWWNGSRTGATEETVEGEALNPPRPFAAFRDPFTWGAAERMSPEQLVRYSFEALLAWAWERDLGRQPGETPLEFTQRVGEEVPALENDARRLANLYVQIAYARGRLTRSCHGPLRQFWQRLVEVVERPMSAGVGGD
jgi:hypothetical protein